VLYIIK